MPLEFLGIAETNDGSETTPRSVHVIPLVREEVAKRDAGRVAAKVDA